MMQVLETEPLLECPSCGRRALVRQNNTLYQCLYCSFRRDLSDENIRSSSLGIWILIVLSTVVLLTLFQDFTHPPASQNPSQPTIPAVPNQF